MSIGEEEISDILEHDPKSRAGCRNLTPADRLARVIEIVLDGGGTPEIKKKLRVPYQIALNLHKNAFAQAWGMIPDLKSPEVLAGIKDDNLNELQHSIQLCREEEDRSASEGKLSVKATNSKATLIKRVNEMCGHNAPTQIETTDRKVFALLNPAVHARIMARADLREALVVIEEFAAAQFDADPDVVIDVTEGGDE